MTREELAAKFCDSTAELHRALNKLRECERLKSASEKHRARSNEVFDALIMTKVAREEHPSIPGPAVTERASADAAVLFAQSVFRLREASILFETAQARVDVLTKEVEEDLETLISASEQATI
jgi:hypothetical protein